MPWDWTGVGVFGEGFLKVLIRLFAVYVRGRVGSWW